jgi:hypothetical protein
MRPQNETVDARVYQGQTQGLWMVDQGLNLPLILSQQGPGYRSIVRGLRVVGHAFRRSPLWNGPVLAEDLACRSERRFRHPVQLRRIKLACGLKPLSVQHLQGFTVQGEIRPLFRGSWSTRVTCTFEIPSA